MDEAFWHARWERNEIGFHEDQVNTHLTAFWDRLDLPAGSRVFLPLCGKSLDMAWLRGEGHQVLGVELSPLAVAAFFDEHNLTPERRSEPPFERWSAQGVEILLGDFFELEPKLLADVAGIYDRASLIALPPAMRPRYARHLMRVAPADAPILLVTLEYPQGEMKGPPFSVMEDEVRGHYGADYRIEVLYQRAVLDENPRFRKRGLSQLTEKVYYLTRS